MNFNLIDLAIIGVLAIFALIGWYRGFLASLLHGISVVGSLIVSGIGYRQFARFLNNRFNALQLTLQFTDVGEAIGDIELSRVVVNTASEAQITQALESCNLPNFISKLIQKNIANGAFSDIGIATIEEYFNQTLAIAVLHVICYVALFALAFIAFELIVSMFLALVRLPVLRQFDSLAGAVVSVIIGMFVVRVVFMLVPTGLSLMAIEQIRAWFTDSAIGSLFYKSQFLLRGIKGTMLK
ncbi:MAG: CvpA family protein [Clostridia bacterium]|nr:CvpA family protein [Clostridia bacterium]